MWLQAAKRFLRQTWVRVLFLGGIGYYIFKQRKNSVPETPDVGPDHDGGDRSAAADGAHIAGKDHCSGSPLLLGEDQVQHQLDGQVQKIHSHTRDDGLASIHTVRETVVMVSSEEESFLEVSPWRAVPGGGGTIPETL